MVRSASGAQRAKAESPCALYSNSTRYFAAKYYFRFRVLSGCWDMLRVCGSGRLWSHQNFQTNMQSLRNLGCLSYIAVRRIGDVSYLLVNSLVTNITANEFASGNLSSHFVPEYGEAYSSVTQAPLKRRQYAAKKKVKRSTL